MRMRALLTALTALTVSGCTSDHVRIYLDPLDRHPAAYELIEEASTILEMDLSTTGRRYGAIKVSVMETSEPMGGYLGGSDPERGCRHRAVWTVLDPFSLAHEIGHQLGLEHVSFGENLMAKEVGTELTFEQREELLSGAGRLLYACP